MTNLGLTRAPLVIDLAAPEGNAFAVLEAIRNYLRRAGRAEECKAYLAEASAGDYQNLLAVSRRYCPELELLEHGGRL